MRRSLLLLGCVAAVLSFSSYARAATCGDAYDPVTGRINVGPFGQNFTVFGASSFSSTYTNNTFTGPSYVQGNIGVGPGGTFSWSDGTIDGDVYMYGNNGFNKSGPATFTSGHGVKFAADGTVPILSGAYANYQALSDNAADCTPTSNYTVQYGSGPQMSTMLTNVNITNSSQSPTVRGAAGQAVVISLQNFVMSQGTFTLEGTNTTTFIINVSNQFSLNNSRIVLADQFGTQYNPTSPDPSYAGVLPSNVLFNIRSKNIQISLNQGTQMSGILLALNDKISLSGGKVYGRAIGGQVNITSGGQVVSR